MDVLLFFLLLFLFTLFQTIILLRYSVQSFHVPPEVHACTMKASPLTPSTAPASNDAKWWWFNLSVYGSLRSGYHTGSTRQQVGLLSLKGKNNQSDLCWWDKEWGHPLPTELASSLAAKKAASLAEIIWQYDTIYNMRIPWLTYYMPL